MSIDVPKKIKKYACRFLFDDDFISIFKSGDFEYLRTALLEKSVVHAKNEYSHAHVAEILKQNDAIRAIIMSASVEQLHSTMRHCQSEGKLLLEEMAEEEARRREYEKYLQDKEPIGFESWSDFPQDLKEHPMFRIVTDALHSPIECSPEWLRRALDAILANKEHKGEIWSAYRRDNELSYEMVRAAISAHQRHTKTDYERLLKQGLGKDFARENKFEY